uniref:Uncharacterized protein n=1 Tax=Arundo donax TaxID=35708 RepID=A0A0A8ZV67_ARUDO
MMFVYKYIYSRILIM